MIVFCHMVVKNAVLGAVQRPSSIPAQRQFSNLWQPVPNDANSDQEQSTKTSIPHSVDGAHIWRHSIKVWLHAWCFKATAVSETSD